MLILYDCAYFHFKNRHVHSAAANGGIIFVQTVVLNILQMMSV